MRIKKQIVLFSDFLIAMAVKEIKTKYRNSKLGFIWVLLNPLLQMFVIGMVFSFFIPLEVETYFLFLLAGLLPWNFFSLSLSRSTSSIIDQRSLISKTDFPKAVIPLSVVLANFFNFLISFTLLLLIILFKDAYLGVIGIDYLIMFFYKLLLLVPLLFFLLFLVCGISLFTSSVNVFIRDINFIVQASLPLLFYATPVIYSLKVIPVKLVSILALNPLTFIITSIQHILLDEPVFINYSTFISLLLALSVTFFGIKIFIENQNRFSDFL